MCIIKKYMLGTISCGHIMDNKKTNVDTKTVCRRKNIIYPQNHILYDDDDFLI